MERRTEQASPHDRTRYLNIVYFIESARSHTIRIKISHAKWALAGGVIVCAWALGSVAWILALEHQISVTRNQLESSLSAVFEYQIKNDKVFDVAYPADATDSYYSESAQLASNNPIAERSDRASSNSDAKTKHPPESPETQPAKIQNEPATAVATSQPATTPVPVATNATAVNPSAAAAQSAPSAETAELIKITNAKISKTGNKVLMEFDITNSNKQKSEGYIWAVASISTSAGQSSYLVAPEHVKLDPANAHIKGIKSAYRFSIQRFKNKSFEFKIPPNLKEWKMTKLSVYFADVDGGREQSVDLPVAQVAINNTSDTAQTALPL